MPHPLTRIIGQLKREPSRTGSLVITVFGDAIVPRGGGMSFRSRNGTALEGARRFRGGGHADSAGGKLPNGSAYSMADAVAQILTWKDADELFAMAHFVAVSRPGHTLSVEGLPGDRVSVLEIPALAISSSDIRARVNAGKPVWYLVPDGVVQYIGKHRLYRGPHE